MRSPSAWRSWGGPACQGRCRQMDPQSTGITVSWIARDRAKVWSNVTAALAGQGLIHGIGHRRPAPLTVSLTDSAPCRNGSVGGRRRTSLNAAGSRPGKSGRRAFIEVHDAVLSSLKARPLCAGHATSRASTCSAWTTFLPARECLRPLGNAFASVTQRGQLTFTPDSTGRVR
jgi:hypothetical protein